MDYFDISELSGRELDRAVAVAMGYTVVPFTVQPYFRLMEPSGEPCNTWPSESEAAAWNRVPEFSSHKPMLGEMLSVIHGRGWQGFLTWGCPWEVGTKPECEIGTGKESTSVNHWASGETPNEAVCRAFLKAVAATADKASGEKAAA